jgi:hypothetical protein
MGANYTIGPQSFFQIFSGRFLVRVHLKKLEGADCDFVVHGPDSSI